MHLKSLIAGGALAFAANGAFAQDYPNRPVTVIVPFVAGGPTDVAARIYGEFFARTLGQQFVIDRVVAHVQGATVKQRAPLTGPVPQSAKSLVTNRVTKMDCAKMSRRKEPVSY